MIVDTSAIIAILVGEPESRVFARLISEADQSVCSVATVVESAIVATNRLGVDGFAETYRVLESGQIEICPVDEIQGELACQAFQRFGKGRHPAQLNFGDCFVYALSKARDLPILCKGDDFAQTDAQLVSHRLNR